MKGIILAGGQGTRLHPLTTVVSKQLLGVYDKPMIYYPLSLLILSGIREILIISSPQALPAYQSLLGTGDSLGLTLQYAVQEKPRGIAEAFIIGRDFMGEEPICLILGDNIFYGEGLPHRISQAFRAEKAATLFAYKVKDPSRYGVIELDLHGNPLTLEEKPQEPRSRLAVPGLYIYDGTVASIASRLSPSERGELEITDLSRDYLRRGELEVQVLGRGVAWFDAGTADSILEASHFVKAVEERQGLKIGCIEEAALSQGFLSPDKLRRRLETMGPSAYSNYLTHLLSESRCGP
jgi:glucose-1-phosphate thymidylyltransferase